ncbi:D-hexose-6-phosphate mutarotase [Vibrio sp. MA40-2]|uniref:D-hexose-6-phosphate mutarotase n=1 Tax=Vibrio sp. MA40-2 TaxID=3391828 RepID=UPI0039A49F30
MEKYLPVVGPLSDHITVVEKNDIKILRVSHPKATADISLHGGHVVSFTPTGHKNILWLSEQTGFDSQSAIRGGIPVCWPWFGRIAAPAHGFARISQWSLAEHRESENGVIICLDLEQNQQTLAIWPYAFHARLYIEITEQLKVTLEVSNTDNKAWQFSGALHSYFNIADVRESVTTGMGPVYSDSLQDGKICQGGTELQLTDTVDRVYTQPESAIHISDPQNDRTIMIKNSGDNAAVIWNPWIDGAKAMGDMAEDGYKTMLCVESTYHATSFDTGKTLQPNETYQISTEISVL